MTSIIRAASPAALLSLVPRLLECRPHRSLVLVPFSAGRSLGALRVDLPAVDGEIDLEVASTVIGMACKVTGTDAVAVVVYTDESLTAATSPPRPGLIAALRDRAHICGIGVVDALVVGPDGWRSALVPLAGEPRPLSEIVEAGADLPGDDIDRDQFSAAALPLADDAERGGIARLLDDVERLFEHPRDGGGLPAPRRRAATAVIDHLGDPPVLFESAVSTTASRLDRRRLAALAFALERPALRDVALMQWVGDIATGDAVFDAQTRFAEGGTVPEDLALPLAGEGAHPDPERLLRALELCRRVCSVVPRERRTGPLSACAWLAWATGRSTHAGTYAEAALDIDGSHGLSSIVRAMIDHARLPEWLFERDRR